ncbi:MAG: S1C family serine protease [Thermoleophilaceae bacterium]
MRRLSSTLLLALAAAGVALLIVGVLAIAGVFSQEGESPAPAGALARGTPASEDLVDRVGESLVSIVVQRGRRVGTVSGFLFDSRGTIVTAASALAGGRVAGVRAEGTDGTIAVQLQGADRASGVAVLKIARDDARDIRPIGSADPDAVRTGEAVLALGAPFALDGVVTSGVVSALDREAVLPGGNRIDGALQTDAAVRHGNVGGPLIDSAGKAIGLLLGRAGVGGVAAPIDAVAAVAAAAGKGSRLRSPSLGLGSRSVDPGLAATLGLDVEHGLLVTRVAPGGPAERAGIRAARPDGTRGDVLVTVAGRQVRRPGDAAAAIARRRPGAMVSIELARGRRQLSVRLRLGR